MKKTLVLLLFLTINITTTARPTAPSEHEPENLVENSIEPNQKSLPVKMSPLVPKRKHWARVIGSFIRRHDELARKIGVNHYIRLLDFLDRIEGGQACQAVMANSNGFNQWAKKVANAEYAAMNDGLKNFAGASFSSRIQAQCFAYGRLSCMLEMVVHQIQLLPKVADQRKFRREALVCKNIAKKLLMNHGPLQSFWYFIDRYSSNIASVAWTAFLGTAIGFALWLGIQSHRSWDTLMKKFEPVENLTKDILTVTSATRLAMGQSSSSTPEEIAAAKKALAQASPEVRTMANAFVAGITQVRADVNEAVRPILETIIEGDAMKKVAALNAQLQAKPEPSKEEVAKIQADIKTWGQIAELQKQRIGKDKTKQKKLEAKIDKKRKKLNDQNPDLIRLMGRTVANAAGAVDNVSDFTSQATMGLQISAINAKIDELRKKAQTPAEHAEIEEFLEKLKTELRKDPLVAPFLAGIVTKLDQTVDSAARVTGNLDRGSHLTTQRRKLALLHLQLMEAQRINDYSAQRQIFSKLEAEKAALKQTKDEAEKLDPRGIATTMAEIFNGIHTTTSSIGSGVEMFKRVFGIPTGSSSSTVPAITPPPAVAAQSPRTNELYLRQQWSSQLDKFASDNDDDQEGQTTTGPSLGAAGAAPKPTRKLVRLYGEQKWSGGQGNFASDNDDDDDDDQPPSLRVPGPEGAQYQDQNGNPIDLSQAPSPLPPTDAAEEFQTRGGGGSSSSIRGGTRAGAPTCAQSDPRLAFCEAPRPPVNVQEAPKDRAPLGHR